MWRRRPVSAGFALLGLWLILSSLVTLAGLNFPGLGILMAIIALIAGIILLIGF